MGRTALISRREKWRTNMIYRSEYPRPQLMRDDWLSLNGEWRFAFGEDVSFDDAIHGAMNKTINVPFSYQYSLSGIGDESYATETCLFLDGKAYKIGAVDVDTFPKPNAYMQPWHFTSTDGCMDLTMTPEYDHHNDLNILVARMNTHQVHGKWSGIVTIDGNRYDIRDMYAFCEYVENRW